SLLKKDREINQPMLNYVIAVRQVQGRRLIDAAFFKRREGSAEYEVVAKAREAELTVDRDAKEINVYMRNFVGLSENGQAVAVVNEAKALTAPLPFLDTQSKRRSRALTREQHFAPRAEASAARHHPKPELVY